MATYATDIAVIIPVFNEGSTIRGTIGALRRAAFSLSEVYVCNDASTDDTLEHARATGVNVYDAPKNGGKAAVLRDGLRYFELFRRYRWVIFLDGDTKVRPDFLAAMLRAANASENRGSNRADLFVGQVQSTRESTLFSALRSFDYTYGQDVAKTGQSNWGVIFVSPGCASMYRTSMLCDLHIASDTLAEDMDLTLQVHAKKGRVVYVPDAIVLTQDPGTLHDYFKQMMRWYRGFWQVVRKYKIFSWRQNMRVAWYMRFLVFDALFCNRIAGFALASSFSLSYLLVGLAMDFSVAGCIAAWAAYRTRRWDTLYKFPLYYWVAYVNLAAVMRSFFEVMVLRRNTLDWNKVQRREFVSSTVA